MTTNFNTLLSPKNDLVFKALFADSPALLTDFINTIRENKEQIVTVEVLNPSILSNEVLANFMRLDILAKDLNGHSFIIEMQVHKQIDWHTQITYNLAERLTQQLTGNKPYHDLKPVIGIHLLDFDLYSDSTQAFWCFELRDRRQPGVLLGNEMQVNIIELRKAKRLQNLSLPLSNWIDYFEHWQEDAVMRQITHAPVKQAIEKLKSLSRDERTRSIASIRERHLYHGTCSLKSGKFEKIEIDIQKNNTRTRTEDERHILQRLLERNFGALDNKNLQRISEADADTLQTWSDRIFIAKTIEEVLMS